MAAAEAEGGRFVERLRAQRPVFACVLAHTDTSMIAGISAAGASQGLRVYTPAADAEVVQLGTALCLPVLPSSPLGAPGPAGITRAALALAGASARFLAAGLRVWPVVAHTRLSDSAGGDIQLGCAVPHARELYASGVRLGCKLAGPGEYLVLGESIPGGTTTALALLLALGYAAEGRVSGSLPGNAHELKTRIARTAIASIDLRRARADPLFAVEHLGDPMQPLAAGLAVGAAGSGIDVVLAGGSQMVAVAALVRGTAGPEALEHMAVGTTRWVVADPHADVLGLAGEVASGLPVLAANLDFSRSRHPGLRAYERFLVKEGVGAGGACIAALLGRGVSLTSLHEQIDLTYDDLLARLSTDASPDPGSRSPGTATESKTGQPG
jgi:uncharacterized protein (TIGR00303 family)